MVDDRNPVTAAAAASPGVTVQRFDIDPDLHRKVSDHRRRNVRLLVGKAAVLSPEGELDRKAELAGINAARQQCQIIGKQRPTLAQLVRRPGPLHSARLYQPSRWQAYGPEAEHVTSNGQIAQLRGHWATS